MKLIALLKRKPGLTREQFIHHYETSHVPIIMKHFGPFVVDYSRTYLNYDHPGSFVGGYEGGGKSSEAPFDVVTTLVFAKPADLDAMYVVAARPEVAGEIAEDEEKFLDRSANQIIISEDERHTAGGARVAAPAE
jgi:hypothetical protein